ncbi:MAG: glycoside hydrolase family 88 protein [Bryobacterales bacterium]|nr:glycoside hydrolase family 88 protein [Bryobacterales bacterium]
MIDLSSVQDQQMFQEAFRLAQTRVRALVEREPGFYPMFTENGKWCHDLPPWTYWCDGFLPGMMWIFAAAEPDPGEASWWHDQAVHYTKPLEPRKFDGDVHDLGLIFMSTFYRWHEITGETALRDVLVEAGRTLAGRYQPTGRYMASFITNDSTFIDMMMNVGLIFYAALEASSPELMDAAMNTCLTIRRTLVRGDGSVGQGALFDIETGAFVAQSTQQGYRADSCWSRGLAWSLYGFTNAYEFCGDARLLSTAEATADFYVQSSPSDGVPPWDFDAPAADGVVLDTSAAAIAASGFFKLSRVVPDLTKGQFYDQVARRILRSLCEKHIGRQDGYEGILKNGVYHMNQKLGVGESVIWGEYFFVEALDEAIRSLDGNG